MRPDIAPESIQAHLRRRGPRARRLEDPARDPQRRIRRHHFYAGNPLRRLSALGCRQFFTFADGVNVADLGTGDVGEGFGGAEVGEEGAVSLEDVGFFGAGGRRIGGVGPRAGGLSGVGGCEGEGAAGDADVEVREDD